MGNFDIDDAHREVATVNGDGGIFIVGYSLSEVAVGEGSNFDADEAPREAVTAKKGWQVEEYTTKKKW